MYMYMNSSHRTTTTSTTQAPSTTNNDNYIEEITYYNSKNRTSGLNYAKGFKNRLQNCFIKRDGFVEMEEKVKS